MVRSALFEGHISWSQENAKSRRTGTGMRTRTLNTRSKPTIPVEFDASTPQSRRQKRPRCPSASPSALLMSLQTAPLRQDRCTGVGRNRKFDQLIFQAGDDTIPIISPASIVQRLARDVAPKDLFELCRIRQSITSQSKCAQKCATPPEKIGEWARVDRPLHTVRMNAIVSLIDPIDASDIGYGRQPQPHFKI